MFFCLINSHFSIKILLKDFVTNISIRVMDFMLFTPTMGLIVQFRYFFLHIVQLSLPVFGLRI